MNCKNCSKKLTGRQTKYCSIKCKTKYSNKQNHLTAKQGYKKIKSSLVIGKEVFSMCKTDNNLVGLSNYKWRYSTKGYVVSSFEYGSVSLHRLIWQFFNGKLLPGQQIDHINRDKLDNRLSNLRACYNSQNAQNKGPIKNKRNSKYKGVQVTASGKYQACIWFNNKNHGLGSYETEEEAALVYNKRAKELNGEFAYQNKIN